MSEPARTTPTPTRPDPVPPPPSSLPVDRSAALAAGAPAVPRKFWYWALGLAAVLALGGTLLEHVLSSTGLNPTSSPTTTTAGAASAIVVLKSGSTGPDRAMAAFMGLAALRPEPSPAIDLVDQHGDLLSLSSLRGDAVVLSFFDGRCNDICPVEEAELKAAAADLGSAGSHVAFVTVNTEPRDTALSGLAPALAAVGTGSIPNWHLVTGSLSTLDSVWQSYGVTINYQPASGLEAHNDVMYFVDQRGDLRFRATPFADESRTGVYSLPAATVARWGHGIATYAQRAYAEGSSGS